MKTLMAAVVGMTLLGSTGCHRGHHDASPERVRGFVHSRMEDMLDDLDATQAQRTQAAAFEEALVSQGLDIKSQTRQAKQELLTQLKSPTPDSARVHALIDERIDAYRKLAHQLADATLQMQQTLSPEQRAKVNKKLARFERH